MVSEENAASSEADRRQDIGLLAGRHGMAIGMTGGGHQTGMLTQEALQCYVTGLFVACLVCSHAASERDLAGRLAYEVKDPPAGSTRWGLGRLIAFARDAQWYPQSTLVALGKLNEHRKDLYHYRDPPGMGALFNRTYRERPWRGKYYIVDDMYQQLRNEAFEALDVTFSIRSGVPAAPLQ